MDDLTKLPLHEILLSNGYTLDREKSSRNNPVLVGDDGQKLVISKKGENYLYFNPNDDNDRGNIISYARIRGISVQELVKTYDPTKEVSLQTTQSFFQNKEQDPYRFIKQYNDFSECVIAQNPLLQRRGFSADMLQAYQGILKQDEKGNLVTAQYKYKCFNHQDKLEEAQKLGASKDEIQNIRDTWRENYADKCAKVHYLQKTAMVNAHKLDEFGQKIPLKNDQGEQRIGKNGKPLFEYDGQVKIKPKTGKSYFEIKQERITLEQPILRTELLYNVAEFKSIDREKIRDLNTQQVKKHLLKNLQEHQNGNDRTRVFFEDLKESLYPETAKQIESYFKAQSFEKDYIANAKSNPLS